MKDFAGASAGIGKKTPNEQPRRKRLCVSEKNPFDVCQQQPLLIVISGPSGVGKDAVIQAMEEHGLSFHFVITTTTREIRPNEKDGRDYFFVSRDEFERMIAQDELLEYNFVYEEYKGIPKRQISQAMASGKDVILRIDVQGAARIRELQPQAVLIFLTVKDEQELVHRLVTRKTETEEKIKKRIETARQEMQCVHEFDYVVENEDGKIDETVAAIGAILCAEHHRVNPRKVTL
jgi:guanylate kinase